MNTAMILSMDTFSAIRNYAQALLDSGFLPSSFKTVQQVIAVMTYGIELNIPAWTAINGINIIQGKPTVSPALMLGLINRSGYLEDMQIEADDNHATVTMKRKGRTAHTEVFTMADANKMQLTGKDNYKKQPRVMLKWRAVSACARVVFPDVLNGLKTTEEIAPDNVTVDDDGIVTVLEMPRLSAATAHSSAETHTNGVSGHEALDMPSNAQNGHSVEIWPSDASVGKLIERIQAKDGLAPNAGSSDIARWGGVSDALNVSEWAKYPTRQEAALAIRAAREAEQNEKDAHDPRNLCKSARYGMETVNGDKRGVVILELADGIEVRMVGRDNLRKLSDAWKDYVANWHAGERYVFADDSVQYGGLSTLAVDCDFEKPKYSQVRKVSAVKSEVAA